MPVTVYLENRESKRTKEKAIRVQLSVKGVTLQSTIGHADYQSMKPYIEIAEKTKADAMKTFEEAMSE